MELLNRSARTMLGMRLKTFKWAVALAILFNTQAVRGDENAKALLGKYTVELGGAISAGGGNSQWVNDLGEANAESRLGTRTEWYLDVQPTIAFYFADYWFAYGSPAFSWNKRFYKQVPLYPNAVNAQATTRTEAAAEVDFTPFFGVGYVFDSENDRLFLSVSTDIQRIEYTLFTRIVMLNIDDTYAYPSLTRFNLRVTPKIRIADRAFLNIGFTVYYETDRLMVAWFGQKGFDARLENFGFSLQLGLSWVF